MCLTNTVVPIRHLSIYLLRASAPKNAMSKKTGVILPPPPGPIQVAAKRRKKI